MVVAAVGWLRSQRLSGKRLLMYAGKNLLMYAAGCYRMLTNAAAWQMGKRRVVSSAAAVSDVC